MDHFKPAATWLINYTAEYACMLPVGAFIDNYCITQLLMMSVHNSVKSKSNPYLHPIAARGLNVCTHTIKICPYCDTFSVY